MSYLIDPDGFPHKFKGNSARRRYAQKLSKHGHQQLFLSIGLHFPLHIVQNCSLIFGWDNLSGNSIWTSGNNQVIMICTCYRLYSDKLAANNLICVLIIETIPLARVHVYL